MENNRPLRQSSNKKRDIRNTYMKNQDSENTNQKNDDEILENLEEKIGAAMKEDEMENEIHIELEEELNQDDSSDGDFKGLEESITNLSKENDQLKDQLARRTAEMENMRKRTEKERMDLVQFANEKLLNNLLEIPDNIKQALTSAKASKDLDAIIQGVDLINSKAVKLFEEAGVKIMEVKPGDEFDVDLHEALMHTPNPDFEEGQIIQVVQDGYYYKERILRHAKVITSSGNE
ncbi:nucleotide exchange factor GrpE [Candidatus Kapabacteria bacterium]|nr:nucleotide exchange factor GrpE [Candidatus Kapabacteria bacterium]